MDKRIRKHVYRGTRPKYSLANSRKVYCDRCECSYDIPVSRNGDQWLNYHWAHFNCIQKKIIRQQEENDDYTLRKPAVSDALKSDKHFVIDGAREERSLGLMMTLLVIYRTGGMDSGDKRLQVLHQNLRNKLPSRSQFFGKEPSIPVSRKRPRSAGGASQPSSALMATADDIDSDDDYVSEQDVDSQNEDESD